MPMMSSRSGFRWPSPTSLVMSQKVLTAGGALLQQGALAETNPVATDTFPAVGGSMFVVIVWLVLLHIRSCPSQGCPSEERCCRGCQVSSAFDRTIQYSVGRLVISHRCGRRVKWWELHGAFNLASRGLFSLATPLIRTIDAQHLHHLQDAFNFDREELDEIGEIPRCFMGVVRHASSGRSSFSIGLQGCPHPIGKALIIHVR